MSLLNIYIDDDQRDMSSLCYIMCYFFNFMSHVFILSLSLTLFITRRYSSLIRFMYLIHHLSLILLFLIFITSIALSLSLSFLVNILIFHSLSLLPGGSLVHHLSLLFISISSLSFLILFFPSLSYLRNILIFQSLSLISDGSLVHHLSFLFISISSVIHNPIVCFIHPNSLSLSLSYAVSVFALGPFTSLLFIGVCVAHLSTICLSLIHYLSMSHLILLSLSHYLSLICSPSSPSLNHCLCLSHITYLLTVIFSLSLFPSLAHYLTLLFFFNGSATSATSHVVLGQFKTCVIMLGGYLFFKTSPGMMSLFGVLIALCGMTFYTSISLQLHRDPASKPKDATKDDKTNDSTDSV